MVRSVKFAFLACIGLLTSHLLLAQWLEIETDHTRIIFEEGDQEYANQLASFADPVFQDIATLVDNAPKAKVPVVLTSRVAWANGYYSQMPSVVVLYLNSPVDRFMGSRTSNNLKSLYTHEITHYLHLTSPVGPAKYLGLLGPGVTSLNMALMPYWWIEGITTYAETAHSQGGRGEAERFKLTFQVPIVEDTMWSLAQGSYDSGYAPLGRYYKTGYLMVDYLMRQYGEKSFARINRDFAAFPFFGISPAIQRVTGSSAKEIFAAALEEQYKSFAFLPDQGVQLSPAGEGNWFLPQMTSIGLVGFSYTLDQGGALLLYREGKEPSVLYHMYVDKRESVGIGRDKVVFAMAWVDSLNVASAMPDPVSYSDLFELDLHTLMTRQLTKGQRLYHPSLSSDASTIVALKRNGTAYDLVSVDTASGEFTLVASSKEGSYYEPSFSPDGNQIACVYIERGNSSLLLLDADGEHVRSIVGPTREEILSPRFDAEGNILFSASLIAYRYLHDKDSVEKLLTTSQGVFASDIVDEELLYETYTPKGFAVRKLPLAQLSIAQASFEAPQVPEPMLPIPTMTGNKFHDWLKLNLVLPFPFVIANTFEPGIWIHAKSLLDQQSLIGSVGWNIENSRLLTDLRYQMIVGSATVFADLMLNQYNASNNFWYHSVVGGISAPFWQKAQPSHTASSSFSFYGTKDWTETVHIETATLAVGMNIGGVANPMDYYGAPFISGSTSYQLSSFNGLTHRVNLQLSGQARVLSSHQMLSFSFKGTYSPTQKSESLLLLHGFKQLATGDAKLQISLGYRMPFGILDQPIPYGGLTTLGVELFAQSAIYANGTDFSWEGAVAVGTRLTASTILGGRKTPFKPYVEFAYLLGKGSMLVTIGIDSTQLLTL